MEYTQEQIDKIKADAVAEATKGLFTQADLDREITRETDRRVEAGIQKGLETQKAKWQAEADKTANMTAEELALSKFKEQTDALAEREKALKITANTLDAKSKLTEAGVPKSYYETLIGNLVNDDVDLTGANVDNLIGVYTSTKTAIEADIKAKLANVHAPERNQQSGDVTKESFAKMGYADKLALKQKNREVYDSMMS